VTATSTRPPTPAPDLETALALVRRRGLRVSSARRLVLQVLFGAEAPVSAEEIALGAGLDVTSVYRNLETLEALGLVVHVHLGHGAGRYAVARGEVREYLVCERCHAVRALPPEALDGVRAAVRELEGFEARFTHFPIAGLCAGCAEDAGHAHP
jgi:Fur family ferric uptake transcriptional regulator